MFSCAVFCLFVLTGFQEASIQEVILNGLKNNDSKSLVKHFSSSVSLSLHGEDRISTRFQSEQLLNEFFKLHKISSIKTVSTGGNEHANNYVVYSIKAGKEDLEVVVKFLEIKGEPTVVEFKIY